MQASPELNMNMINMQSSLWNLALFFFRMPRLSAVD